MKLISEEATNVEFLTETTKSGGKSYFIEGIFMQSDTRNRNGRIYPKEILQKSSGPPSGKNLFGHENCGGCVFGVPPKFSVGWLTLPS